MPGGKTSSTVVASFETAGLSGIGLESDAVLFGGADCFPNRTGLPTRINTQVIATRQQRLAFTVRLSGGIFSVSLRTCKA